MRQHQLGLLEAGCALLFVRVLVALELLLFLVGGLLVHSQ
jgi:hypothetical protein